jgi:hypothetical protein
MVSNLTAWRQGVRVANIDVEQEEVTLASLAARMDMLGKQMDWLCENLQALFLFVNQVSSNGGGIRGMLSALKHAPPQIQSEETPVA